MRLRFMLYMIWIFLYAFLMDELILIGRMETSFLVAICSLPAGVILMAFSMDLKKEQKKYGRKT